VEPGVLITLPRAPRLTRTTAAARTSCLVGEQAGGTLGGIDTDWLDPASKNFDEFVAVRRGAQTRRGDPSALFRPACAE
jgi:hypothetical protein